MVLKSQSVLSQNLVIKRKTKDFQMGILNSKNSNPKLESGKESVRVIESRNDKKIALQLDDGIHLVSLNDIIRIESNHNYVFIYLYDGRSIFISLTLKQIEQSFSDFQFVRVHNSHVINLAYLNVVKKSSSPYAIINNTARIPVSRRRLPFLLDKIKDWAIWL